MKNSLKYIILLLLVIVLVVLITFSHLKIHYSEKGTVKIIKNYYDVVFNNTIVENDGVKIKVNNADDSIHIEVPNIVESKEIRISLDAKNIGNKDVLLDSFSYSNVDSNIDTEKVIITSSLENKTVIKGSESKKINIVIKYIGNEKTSNSYYNFNINYTFDEVKL